MKIKITQLLWLGLLAPFFISAQSVTTLYAQVGIDDDLILDAAGNLYGSNYAGSAVRLITPGGEVSIFINGLSSPNGLAFDSAGNLFIVDNQGNKIYKAAPEGSQELFAETFSPSGIIKEPDSDTMIVTSYTGNKILKMAPDGSLTDFLTRSTLNEFNGPVGLCYDEAQNLYIANFNDRKIFKVTPDGEASFFTQAPESGRLGFIAYVNGYLYATLFTVNKIAKISLDGSSEVILGSTAGNTDGEADVARFNGPNGIRPSASGDTLFVSDFNSKSIRMITNLEGVTAGQEEQKARLKLQVTPNPSSETAWLSFELSAPKSVQLSLFGSKGRRLRDILSTTLLSVGTHHYEVDVKGLPPGHYFCQLAIEGEGITVEQLFIQR